MTARTLNEESLQRLGERLGPDHHYYLTVATNLASDLAVLGDYEAAVELGRDTHRRLTAVLGDSHPMTLACGGNLSADLAHLGTDEAAEEAATLREDISARYAQRLTLEHPDAVVFQEGRHLDLDFDPPPI